MARRILLALAAAGAVGGLVAGASLAQPFPPPIQAPPQEAAPPPPDAAPPQEPPPPNVPPPAPLIVPPILEAPAKPQVPEKPAEPIRRERYDTAVLQALDKVTAETLRFEAAVGRPVRWKGLVFTVRACERSAPDEPVEDSIAYLEIESQPRPQPGKPTPPPRQAFKGWMFASSPSLNPLEHISYDAWVISCRASAPATPPAAAPVRAAPKPAPEPKPAASEPKATPAPAPEEAPAAGPPPAAAPPPVANEPIA
jgi:hypothetical protein